MRVVDQKDQRTRRRRFADELVRGECDVESVGHLRVGDPECRLERAPSRIGQAVAQPEDRSQQLMQAGERELGFRLDANGGEDLHVRGLGARPCVLQQRRLADTGIAADHERSTVCRKTIEHRVEAPHLIVAPDQSGRLEFGGGPPRRLHSRTPYGSIRGISVWPQRGAARAVT